MNYIAIPGLKFRPRHIPARGFVNSDRIINMVLCHFNLSFREIRRKSRYRHIVYPRQVLMYLLSKNTNLTLKEIARVFYKDHTTVIHSITAITQLMETDSSISMEVNELEDLI